MMDLRCEMCGSVRPAAEIEAYTVQGVVLGVPFTRNVSYCKDCPLCHMAAEREGEAFIARHKVRQ